MGSLAIFQTTHRFENHGRAFVVHIGLVPAVFAQPIVNRDAIVNGRLRFQLGICRVVLPFTWVVLAVGICACVGVHVLAGVQVLILIALVVVLRNLRRVRLEAIRRASFNLAC